VDISGCILTDDPATNKFVIPPGTVIPPARLCFFTQSQLVSRSTARAKTHLFHQARRQPHSGRGAIWAQRNGVSYGRWPDGANDFYRLTAKHAGHEQQRRF
jgi:hypothetical protein